MFFSNSSFLFSSFSVLLLLLKVANTNSQHTENLKVCQINNAYIKRPDELPLKVLRELASLQGSSTTFEKSWKIGEASF